MKELLSTNQKQAMSSLAGASQEQTMSSFDLRGIINVARVEHQEPEVANRHFLARIEDELEGELGDRKSFTHPQNHKQIGYYDLTRDQCTLVGMRESKYVRRKVLEILNKSATPRLPNFSNPAEAARAWADEVEAKEAAVALIEQQKPAVEFVQKYVEADNLKGFREVCKLLNANERDFRQFLVEQKIVYRLGGAWTAYKPHIEAGRMDTKAATANGKTFNQIMFTAKGVTWIAEKWAKHNLSAR